MQNTVSTIKNPKFNPENSRKYRPVPAVSCDVYSRNVIKLANDAIETYNLVNY